MKPKRIIIFIGIVICIGIGVFLIQSQSVPMKQELVLGPEYTNDKPKEIEEQDRLFKFCQSILEETLKGKVALIDPQMTRIEEDAYNRYFLKIESIGIDNQYKIEWYHYYFVIQKSAENQLYMMPFGLEELVGEVDDIKEDILISMLKLTNGWEISEEEVLEKWKNTMDNSSYNQLKETTLNINNLYYIQSLICFINDYIYEKGADAFLKIGDENVRKEVLEFNLEDIEDKEVTMENRVEVSGRIRVYGKKRIQDYKIKMIYDVYMDELGNFEIRNQTGFLQ